jgi:hypothetical protein
LDPRVAIADAPIRLAQNEAEGDAWAGYAPRPTFSTGNPDGRIATTSQASTPGDEDFVLSQPARSGAQNLLKG